MRSFFRRTRVRLTVLVAVAFLLIAGAVASAFWLTFSHLQYSAIDFALRSYGNSLLAGWQDNNGTLSIQGADSTGETDQGFAVGVTALDGRGHVVLRLGSAPPLALLASAARQAASGHRNISTTVAWSGKSERLLAMPAPSGTTTGAVVLSQPLTGLDQTLVATGVLLTAIVLVLGAVVAVLAYVLTGRALRPVRVIADTAREISERDLHRRVDLDLPRDELGELAATFNAMLSRLEASFASLEQLTADAAHELRAPLALVRTELEVSLRSPRSTSEHEASERVALAEVERLGAIVDRLLIIARADAGDLRPAGQEVDIADMLDETAERWRRIAGEKGVDIQVSGVAEGKSLGDPELLQRLLDNLVDNAVRHTPQGGLVTLEATVDAAGWAISVSDTGPGVRPEIRPALFRRFARWDPARARETGGAGLGLALCRVIAEAHGGEIFLEEGAISKGARFVVRLPLRSAATGVPRSDIGARHVSKAVDLAQPRR